MPTIWRAELFRTTRLLPKRRHEDKPSLTTVGILCAVLTLWLADTLHIPAAPARAGSLLQQSAPLLAIGVAWVALTGGAMISSVFASGVHYDGGLFCAALGLAALAARMGPARFALFNAHTPGVYLLLALETLILGLGVVLAWMLLRRAAQAGKLPLEQAADPNDDPDEPLDQKLLATAAQIILTLLGVIFLVQTDQKMQTLCGLFISASLAALAAHHFVPARPSIWFFCGPFVVAIIGYLSQFFWPGEWMIGDPRGMLAPLTRAMPLDYASAGTAGALLGYWTSRRWQLERQG
jgi:hypothetical protein